MVNRIMKSLMSAGLGVQYSLYGRKGEYNFSVLKLKEVVSSK
jgi:hypothetical protein